jgi:hypothetical protein
MDVHSTTEPATLVRQPQATTSGREMGMNWRVLSVVCEFGVVMMTEVRGASNAKAKRDLAWRPTYPSRRDGSRSGLGSAAHTKAA